MTAVQGGGLPPCRCFGELCLGGQCVGPRKTSFPLFARRRRRTLLANESNAAGRGQAIAPTMLRSFSTPSSIVGVITCGRLSCLINLN
jgi:hypothetical protein